MDAVMAVKQGLPGAALPEPRQRRHAKTSLVEIAEPELGVRSDVERRIDVPTPPFWDRASSRACSSPRSRRGSTTAPRSWGSGA